MDIKTYQQCASAKVVTEIQNIFFETSTKTDFKNPEEKLTFFEKYCGYYLKHHPNFFFLALHENKIVGYLCGAVNSASETELYTILSHYGLFEDQYLKYPAHLHMNLTAKLQGQGIGTLLVEAFVNKLKETKVKGMHIITAPKARNVGFYQKNNFAYQLERDGKLFMGKMI
ncbi:MAG: GNAT family N-acetyltransferase [Bacteriovoracaceae bacterium]|nr:GNAT family N-acetyltransferase [Bacteriovoracaceae bacterium]